jgi:aminomethyltransferase
VVGGGVVTSGTFSPCRRQGIGMAYVPADRAEVGGEIEIDVRGRTRSALIESKPLYSRSHRKGS